MKAEILAGKDLHNFVEVCTLSVDRGDLEMRKTTPTTIRIQTPVKEAVQELAIAKGTKFSKIVHLALRQYLADQKTA
jgi:heterodisulfide reductase subunit B